MTHAWALTQGRNKRVKVVDCAGELAPLEARPAWHATAGERLFKCADCGSVLGLIGDSVDWAVSAADWKSLGR